jgi:hypothetical protein
MSEPDDDLPPDPDLRAALRSWEVEPAPEPLGRRVLASYRERTQRPSRWRRFLTMPVRLPLPLTVAVGALLLIVGYLAGRNASRPGPAVAPPEVAAEGGRVAGFPLVTQTPLAGFRPLGEVKIKVLPKEDTHEK